VYPSLLRPADLLDGHATAGVAAAYDLGAPSGAWVHGDSGFFDVQTLRRHHVACARVEGLKVALDLGPNRPLFGAPVSVHLLLHMTGLIAYRLTIRSDQVAGPHPASLDDFHRFHESMWRTREATWTFPSDIGSIRVVCGVRGLMDRLFFTAHERSQGRPYPDASTMDRWTADFQARYERLEELVRIDGLTTAYPVSFGTHYELAGVDVKSGETLALMGSLAPTAPDVVAEHSPCHWFLTENKSVLVTPSGSRPANGDDAIDPGRTTLLEYLTLRRAALRSVQRATQQAITEGERVSRLQVAAWERLIASLSDEYVLHDDIGAVYEPLKRQLRESDALRDLSALESQVRTNVDSFGSQLDAATDRAGVFLGILFGVVAATSLAPLAQHLASLLFGLPETEDSFLQGNLWVASALEIGLVAIVLLVAYALYRNVTRAPFRRGRG
jgi:hypothetical protein